MKLPILYLTILFSRVSLIVFKKLNENKLC